MTTKLAAKLATNLTTRLRLIGAVCAVIASVIVVWHSAPPSISAGSAVELRSTAAPMTGVSTTIKYPVIEITDPRPFDPCEDIPLDVVERLGLAFTPPQHEDGLRCHFDAGNYQMAIEAIVWRTYADTLPPDAVELTLGGKRAAEYWIIKPTERNNRFWVTCMVAYPTSYGVLMQSIFYAPVYSVPDVDCLQTNRQRAEELVPYYVL